MHEMSIARDIIQIVQQNLPPDSEGDVRAVKLKIGDLSGVIPQSLEFCFNILVQNTSLRRARLIMEQVPVRAFCRDCTRTFVQPDFMFRCPHCHESHVDVLSGRELQVVEFDLEDREEADLR